MSGLSAVRLNSAGANGCDRARNGAQPWWLEIPRVTAGEKWRL